MPQGGHFRECPFPQLARVIADTGCARLCGCGRGGERVSAACAWARSQEAALAAAAGVHGGLGLLLGLGGGGEGGAGLPLGLGGLRPDEGAAAGAQGEVLRQGRQVSLLGLVQLPLRALLAEQIIPAQSVRGLSIAHNTPVWGQIASLQRLLCSL